MALPMGLERGRALRTVMPMALPKAMAMVMALPTVMAMVISTAQSRGARSMRAPQRTGRTRFHSRRRSRNTVLPEGPGTGLRQTVALVMPMAMALWMALPMAQVSAVP